VAAHCLTAMVVQAAAARVVALQDPHGAAEALGTLTSSGRTALSELRRLADLPLDPQASPAHAGLEPFLSSLADDVSVELAWPEGRRTIPAAVGPVAVRVVQEGLTNAARHAPGAKVSVRVSVGADVLDVRVANGPAVRSAGGAPGGYGLLGMRERVAALRGSVSTGPTAAGGYAVHARLPLDTDTAEPVASTPRPRTRDRVLGVGVPLACSAVLVTEAVVSDHRVGPVVLNVLVVAVMGLAGLLRRRAPVAFLVVVGALSLLLSAGLTSRDYATLTGLYTAVVPAYAVGCWAARRRAVAAMALWGVAATAAGMAQHAHPAGLLGPLMTAGLAACLGALVQEHRTMEQRLAAAENAVREQTLVLEQMSAESERTRLAERHDHDVARVVAHMLDLATTAARLHEAGDPRLVAALAEIESEGRGALERMRAIVGSLRASPDESLVAAPVPA
jgi:signal transduction histidine kinase